MHRAIISLVLVGMLVALQLFQVSSLPPDFFRVGRNAKRLVGYQLKRDISQDAIISASCLFCGEAYGGQIAEACRSEEETTRACVNTFLAELKAFSRSRGW